MQLAGQNNLSLAEVQVFGVSRGDNAIPQVTNVAKVPFGRPPLSADAGALASGQETFYVRVEGTGLDPCTARVVVVGPGCPDFGDCETNHLTLIIYGEVSTSRLALVPLTLAPCSYTMYVQNGATGRPSNSWMITFP